MVILFVEDDRNLASVTMDFLNHEGIDVDYACHVQSAKTISEDQNYDAIVLDLHLPDGDGFELARYFAKKIPATPILFLTAEHQLDTKLEAFALGALDYLTKPFELAELAIRLKLLKQKSIGTEHRIFSLDTLKVNQCLRTVTRGQRVVTLSPQQWQLLTLLIEMAPMPVSKTSILSTIWGDQDVSQAMYKTLLSRLRKNISQNDEIELVHTIKGVGVVINANA